jgi:hypothetical protein
MKTFKAIKNLITGKDIKEMELKPVILYGLILKENHILIGFSRGNFYIKHEDGITILSEYEIFECYNIKITRELINKLSIK